MEKRIEEGHKYDEIQTAEELVNEIAINGISLNQNDQIRAQDIIGHSSVGELENLANGKLGGKFYFLLQHIWNIEDVIRFWNNHSNQEHKEFQICREKVKKLTKENEESSTAYMSLLKDYGNLKKELAMLESKEKKSAEEILKLKARLFDMMEQQGIA